MSYLKVADKTDVKQALFFAVAKNKITTYNKIETWLESYRKKVIEMASAIEDIRATQLQQVREIAEIRGDIKLIDKKIDDIATSIKDKKSSTKTWLIALVAALIAAVPGVLALFIK